MDSGKIAEPVTEVSKVLNHAWDPYSKVKGGAEVELMSLRELIPNAFIR
jgi:hypothetical protein